MTFFIFGVNISYVKILFDPVQEDFNELLFDDPDRDNFREPTYILGEKMFMFLGVEDGFIVPWIVVIGMSSVVSLGINGWVALSVTAHGIPGSVASIHGAVSYVLQSAASMLPVIVSVGYVIYVLK